MMIDRILDKTIHKQLVDHPDQPVILEGAAGTGKFTLASAIARRFAQPIILNMEDASQRKLFDRGKPFDQILRALSFASDRNPSRPGIFIVIRELQACHPAMEWFAQACLTPLRTPLLATVSSSGFSDDPIFSDRGHRPVVFRMNPFSFSEFLTALNEPEMLAAFDETPSPHPVHPRLLERFHLYSLIGGMPAIMAGYLLQPTIRSLGGIYESILLSWETRIQRSCRSEKTGKRDTEILRNIFPYAATRIIFNQFGNLGYRSREIIQSFRQLENHGFLRLIYPFIHTNPPAEPHPLKAPRLHVTDTGMVNYFSGIQKILVQSNDMNTLFQGQIARQVVAQELETVPGSTGLRFWVRNKNQSSAEVDFLIPYKDMWIPVMVRSGEPGRLRSLHQFMDESRHPFAVRLSADPLTVRQSRTIGGKKYFLLNLPYYAAGKIPMYLDGFIRLSTG